MPLNKFAGEVYEHPEFQGQPFTIEDNSKWRLQKVYQDACESAEVAFREKRKLSFLTIERPKFGDDQILIQRYEANPAKGWLPRLLFLFCAKVGDKEHFVALPFWIPPQTLNNLRLAGLWPDKVIH